MDKNIKTGNSIVAGFINKSIITDIIMKNDTISRSEIARKTNLALPTVMRIVDKLIDEGLIEEVGKADSSGGRKAVLLSLKENAIYFVGVEITNTVKVIVCGMKGVIISSYEERARVESDYDILEEQVYYCLDIVLKKSSIDIDKIGGIGVATPDNEFKYKSSSLHQIKQINLKEWCEKKEISCPIIFENVAKVGALGEMMFGEGLGSSNFLYVFADYSIGLGIVINNRFYRGVNSVSGEFGHNIIVPKGKRCYCGNYGCIEMYASIPAIINWCRDSLDDNSDSLLHEYLKENSDELSYPLILKAARNNDALSLKVLSKAGRYLGHGVGNLINLFNPEKIILGGSLSESEIYVKSAIKTSRSNIFTKNALNTEIVLSEVKQNAGTLGAAAMVMARLFGTAEW